MYFYLTFTILTLMPVTAAAMFLESRRTTTPPHETPDTPTYRVLQTIELALAAGFIATMAAAGIRS